MGCKLMEKLRKIYSWVWWNWEKKPKYEDKFENTPFHSFIWESVKHILGWNLVGWNIMGPYSHPT